MTQEAGLQEDGRLLRILSKITPWYRIPRQQQEEQARMGAPPVGVKLQEAGRSVLAQGADLQEGRVVPSLEVDQLEEGRVFSAPGVDLQEKGGAPGAELQEEGRIPGARAEGSSAQEVAGAALQAGVKEGSSQVVSEPVQEVQEFQEAPSRNQSNAIQNNLELFERSIEKQSMAKALQAYDDKPESRVSYKLMHDKLVQENTSLHEIIKHGRIANSKMQDKLLQYEKFFLACDTKTTETLMETNIELKSETEFLCEKLNKQN